MSRFAIAIFVAVSSITGSRLALADIAALHVYPNEINLNTARDFQRVLVIAVDDSGIHRDVTDEVDIQVGANVELHGRTLFPIGDGTAPLRVVLGELSVEVNVAVKEAMTERPVSWQLDVMPVFMASGCNSGACHGSARGQDGFRLSLFGFDPKGDYQRVTRQYSGRRINLGQPAESLLLEKPLAMVPHTGGQLFTPDSAHYEALHRWIVAGVPRDADDVLTVVGLDMFPASVVLASEEEIDFVVRARYSDGTDRDVSDLAVFRTNNETSAAVVPGGRVTAGVRGEAFVTASFDTFAVGTSLIVLPSDAADEVDLTTELDQANYIDQFINDKLGQMRILPSGLCSDEVFLRRAYLDLIGQLPTPRDRAGFLADEAADKRASLINQLLQRREFVDQWVMEWAELLQIRSNNQISYKSALLYFEWLRNSFSNDVPLDEMVRRILTATGGTFTEPPTNFYQNQQETIVLSENVAQSFMGIRIQCAQCHNHPFDRWTQNDYYGLAAFFTQLGRKRAEDQRETIIFDRRRGEINHPVTGQVAPPKFLGAEVPEIRNQDRRVVFANWLTAPENPYFARSIANRIWAHFMGVGIVEPVDDFRISNPASNPQLLDALSKRLVGSGYSIKGLVRDICNSHAYQRATQTNPTNTGDGTNFSHAAVRRLRAETLLDVICQATEVPQKLRGLPLGARAVEIADGTTTNYFLTTFGRARRDSVCSCEVVREPSLSQALHLLNGNTTHGKVNQGNVVGKLLDSGQTPEQVIDSLYVRCLARASTEDERAAILAIIAENPGDQTKAVLEDAFWALLNSQEFYFNH